MNLEKKVVIVTGASSGIGKQTAIALGEEKAIVVLVARRKERLKEVAQFVEKAGGISSVYPADAGDEDQVEQIVSQVIAQHGIIDVLINNAGSGLFALIEETTPSQMEHIWRANFLSTFNFIRAVLPHMKKQMRGHVITVSSMAGRRGTPFLGAYCASKFAQTGLMDSLRRELAGTGIHCTVVYPGATDTEFLDSMENPGRREIRNYGFVQKPATVAREIIRVIHRPRTEVITQRFGRLLILLNALSPSWVDTLVDKTIKRKQRGG